MKPATVSATLVRFFTIPKSLKLSVNKPTATAPFVSFRPISWSSANAAISLKNPLILSPTPSNESTYPVALSLTVPTASLNSVNVSPALLTYLPIVSLNLPRTSPILSLVMPPSDRTYSTNSLNFSIPPSTNSGIS